MLTTALSNAAPSAAQLASAARTTVQPLPGPQTLRSRLPAPDPVLELVSQTRRAIRDLLSGRSKRLLVLAGPCSIHDRSAALEYATRLRRLADLHREQLVVVMRSYFEKPRTTLGWKGLLIDPDLDGSCDIARGLELSRRLLIEIGEIGIPCGGELLGPISSAYFDDLLCWAAIGARTVESQPHRELASGLGLPIGVKNAMDGRSDSALDALVAIREPHTYLGLDSRGAPATIRTAGNPDVHLVLRGGEKAPNFDAGSILGISRAAEKRGLASALVVDCSHGNSGKDHRKQGRVCREVLAQVRGGQRAIAGLALESHLRPGRQPASAGAVPGLSITDACIGWSETEDLLAEAAEAVAPRL